MKHYHILRAHVREPDPRAAPARNIFREDLYTSRIWVGWVGGWVNLFPLSPSKNEVYFDMGKSRVKQLCYQFNIMLAVA